MWEVNRTELGATLIRLIPDTKSRVAPQPFLFAWLVGGQVIPRNPAGAGRGPKPLIPTGKPSVLPAEETRRWLDRIDPSTLIGLRDRARSGLMVSGLARVSAALAMRVADHDTQGQRSFFRLHEQGGTYLVMPAPQRAQAWTDDDIARAGLAANPQGPLVPAAGRHRGMDRRSRPPRDRAAALKMMKRRAQRAGLPGEGGAQSCRGTGITEYLRAGGALETAARMAGPGLDPPAATLQPRAGGGFTG